MVLIEEMKHQWDVMLHPGGNHTKPMKLSESLIYYYKVSLIPAILAIITEYIYAIYGAPNLLHSLGPLLSSSQGLVMQSLVNAHPLAVIISVMSDFIIFIPLLLFICAGIIHIFGKVFRKYHKTYTETVSGSTYTVCAIMFLSFWIVPLIQSFPIGAISVALGVIVSVALGIWNLIILVISLAKLQKTTRLASFGIIITPVIIVAILALIAIASFIAH